MKFATFTTAISLLYANSVSAAEEGTGKYIVGGGAGGVSCPSFDETMGNAKKHGVNSIGYANETSGFLMYLFGFQTAYNLQKSSTCDIFGNFDTNQLLTWVENYCTSNPLENYGSGVVALSAEVHPRRQQRCK